MASAKAPEPTSTCAKCQQSVPTSGMQRHLDWQCSAAEVSCGECDGTFTRGTLAKHLFFDCKNTDSECPLAPYGCKAKIPKAKTEAAKKAAFDDHMASSTDAHMRLIVTERVKVDAYRRALHKQVDARDFELTYLAKEATQLGKQLHAAKALRTELTAQLADYEKLMTTFGAFMKEKVAADPSLAPGAAADDDKKTAAAGTAAAGKDAKDGGSGVVDAKADKSLQDFADDKRGAEALIVHYRPRPATAPALVDFLPKLKSATVSITQFGRVTLTDVSNIAVLASYRLSEYRTFAERKIAAEYIAAYYSVRSNSVTDEEAAAQIMEEQRVMGALVWGLTCGQPSPAAADASHADANLVDELGLDFAKVLADPKRIAVAFDRIVARGILNDDVMSVWMTCAMLGRWALAKELTSRAKELLPDALEVNHMTALQNHNIPDMSIIQPLTQDADGKVVLPDADVADLKFAGFEVRSMVLQMLTCEHPNPQIVAALKAEYKQFPEGKDLVVTGEGVAGRVLLAQGAFVQMRSIAFPMPLSGPYLGDRMQLVGEMDMEAAHRAIGKSAASSLGAGAGGAADDDSKQTQERYDLKRVETKGQTSTWQGNMQLMTREVGSAKASAQTLKATFKVTMVLFEREINDPDIHAALGAPRVMGEDDDDVAAAMAAQGGPVMN